MLSMEIRYLPAWVRIGLMIVYDKCLLVVNYKTVYLSIISIWKFGDYKHFTSLALLTEILGIPSPKDDIDGSDVARVYYEEKNLPRIIRYCEKDVLSLAQVILRFLRAPLLEEDQIVWLSE